MKHFDSKLINQYRYPPWGIDDEDDEVEDDE
jgi:hypothetical protein